MRCFFCCMHFGKRLCVNSESEIDWIIRSLWLTLPSTFRHSFFSYAKKGYQDNCNVATFSYD